MMDTDVATQSPPGPDRQGANFTEIARGLAGVVAAGADEAEQLRHQAPAVVAALRAAGIYRLLLPRALGGAELPYAEAMRTVAEIAYADGSAGWCTMVANVAAASVGAFLPDAGAQQMFAAGPDVLIAGQGVPRGTAHRADGGWLVRGAWSYGSGIHFADVIHSGCFVMEGDKPALDADGLPVALLVHCSPDAVRIDDNWHTLGLRGTGSYDYALKTPALFVPDAMCYLYAADRPLRGGPAYRIGLIGLTAWGHSSWALGIGRRILDELAGLARTKGGPLGLIGDSAAFRQGYADAEARYRSARAFCLESWADLDAALAAGEPPSLQQIALVRMAMRHLHDVLSDMATFAHRAAGGASLRAGVLQRCYRDVHSGTQHVLLADQIYQACGQVLLGLTGAGAHWGLFGVLE